MRLFLLFFLFSISVSAQIPVGEDEMLQRLKTGGPLPDNLLSSRTVVFYPYTMQQKELDKFQETFYRTGIDAVVYILRDFMAAGRDPSVALAEYLNAREISNIAIVGREADGYTIQIFPYNRMANLFEDGQGSWSHRERTLDLLLQHLSRTATQTLKRENLLINEVPELAMPLNIFRGARNEFFAIDLKVDPLAVPKTGNVETDRQLEEIMKGYPYKYKFTEPGWSESQIRQDGSYYVLRFVHARDKAAHRLLGYDAARSQTAIVSITYPGEKSNLKNIPADAPVFKFYFKHIDSGNIFLGTKWDADLTWQEALTNQLRGFKSELKIN